MSIDQLILQPHQDGRRSNLNVQIKGDRIIFSIAFDPSDTKLMQLNPAGIEGEFHISIHRKEWPDINDFIRNYFIQKSEGTDRNGKN